MVKLVGWTSSAYEFNPYAFVTEYALMIKLVGWTSSAHEFNPYAYYDHSLFWNSKSTISYTIYISIINISVLKMQQGQRKAWRIPSPKN
jgi:hypothetical protein